jgi:hypothetical protein
MDWERRGKTLWINRIKYPDETPFALTLPATAIVPIEQTPFGGESTSAALRRTEAELGSALAALAVVTRDRDALVGELHASEGRRAEVAVAALAIRDDRNRLKAERDALPRLPATDDEVRQWYADRHLAMSCGAAWLFAALRKDFNQTTEET